MNSPFNILTAVFICLQSFPTQNEEMQLQSFITSITLNDGESKSDKCCEKSESKNDKDCPACHYCIYFDSENKETKSNLLFMTTGDDIEKQSQTPQHMLIDYDSKEDDICISYSKCLATGKHGNGKSHLFFLPSDLLYTYKCESCTDNKIEIKLKGLFSVVNRFIGNPFRFCILNLVYIDAKEDTSINNDDIEENKIKQVLIVNEKKKEDEYEYDIKKGVKGEIYKSTIVNCRHTIWKSPKITVCISDEQHRLNITIIKPQLNGEFNIKNFYVFYNQSSKTKISGHFEAVTTSTVVGMNDSCRYESPISCSNKITKHCFVRNVKPDDCTPEKAYCAGLDCKNGGKCETFGKDRECICKEGYYGSLCDLKGCQGGCNNGKCSQSGECSCHSGWSGHDCSTRICTRDACNRDECTLNGNDYECKCNPLNSTGNNCEFRCEATCSDSTCTLIDGKPTCAILTTDITLKRKKLGAVNATNNANSEEQNIDKKKVNDNHRRTILIICLTVVFVIIFATITIFVAKKYVIRKDKNTNANFRESETSCPYIVANTNNIAIYEDMDTPMDNIYI